VKKGEELLKTARADSPLWPIIERKPASQPARQGRSGPPPANDARGRQGANGTATPDIVMAEAAPSATLTLDPSQSLVTAAPAHTSMLLPTQWTATAMPIPTTWNAMVMPVVVEPP
jgi:hypothetical protein